MPSCHYDGAVPSPGDKAKEAVLGYASRFLFSLPDGLLTRLFGRPPVQASGLRADVWAICRVTEVLESLGGDLPPVEARVETELLSRAVSLRRIPRVETIDFDLGDDGQTLPARLYRPASAPATGPLLLYFHGGGWVLGSLESHDLSCRYLADNAGVRILAVDYRLAPEDPFPAAADDALAAWKAVQADPDKFGTAAGLVAVGGDSAGGNLATVLCQDLLAEGSPQPAFQMLIYPVVEIGSIRPSKQLYSTGFYLTTRRMDWFDELYAAGTEDVRASPIKSRNLSGLAPAWIVTALADPLRDEGEAYAELLAEAGVPVQCDRFPLVHAWFNMTASRSSKSAHAVLARGLIERFSASAAAADASSTVD